MKKVLLFMPNGSKIFAFIQSHLGNALDQNAHGVGAGTVHPPLSRLEEERHLYHRLYISSKSLWFLATELSPSLKARVNDVVAKPRSVSEKHAERDLVFGRRECETALRVNGDDLLFG